MHHSKPSIIGNAATIEFLAEVHNTEPDSVGFESNYGHPSNTWHRREIK